jgi:glycosyltransferase involved in cell wall biosynthesis
VDVIKAEQTGFVFNDVKDALLQINTLLDDDVLGEMISKAGRLHSAKQYSVERYAREINSLIKD